MSLISPRYKGTRVPIGSPMDDGEGYAVDDPPEPSEHACDICEEVFTEGDTGTVIESEEIMGFDEADLCAKCNERFGAESDGLHRKQVYNLMTQLHGHLELIEWARESQ